MSDKPLRLVREINAYYFSQKKIRTYLNIKKRDSAGLQSRTIQCDDCAIAMDLFDSGCSPSSKATATRKSIWGQVVVFVNFARYTSN